MWRLTRLRSGWASDYLVLSTDNGLGFRFGVQGRGLRYLLLWAPNPAIPSHAIQIPPTLPQSLRAKMLRTVSETGVGSSSLDFEVS